MVFMISKVLHLRAVYLKIIVSALLVSLVSAQLPNLSLFSSLGQHFRQLPGGSPNQPGLTQKQTQQQTAVADSILDRKCLMCKFSVSLINYALKTKRGYDQVDRIANNFCMSAHLESPLVCSKISKLFNHEITKVLTYGVVTPDQVCGLLSNNTCGHFHSPLDDWEINIQASELINQTELAQTKPRHVIFDNETSTDLYRVVHISDTHVDLNYAEGSPAKCEEPLCCQATSTPRNSSVDPEQEKAGHWGTYGLCDIPLRTFVATLKHLNETLSKQDNNIEYIIWTGDIQPHDVWAQSKRTALQVYETVFNRIFKYLPSAIILPTFGNHEMIPVDSFSPSNLLQIAKDDAPTWLYQKFDAFWMRWLPQETEATITRDGFYAVTVRPGLKVVSLNTNFCHSRNFWLFINSTDPGNQLQWLVHELQMSELSHEKVHIIGHIPPGADDCMRVWSKNYHRIVSRYSTTIKGQFFGHTHTSEFEMFYDQEPKFVETDGLQKGQREQLHTGRGLASHEGSTQKPRDPEPTLKPISVAQIGPSVTTFIELNPSYRIYLFDPKRDFQAVDFETFYVNLTEANQSGKSGPLQWRSAGNFSQMFGINDISPNSMHQLMFEIANTLRLKDLQAVGDNDEITKNAEVEDGLHEQEDDDDEDAATDNQAANSNSTSTSVAPALESEDRLFNLYKLYNSFSDRFTRAKYEKISQEEKKKFVCRLLTGRSHDPSVCKRIIPNMDVPKIVL